MRARRFSKAEWDDGPALVPFTLNSALGGNSLAPAEKPRPDSRFYYADINGDGLVDLVTFSNDIHGSSNEFVPLVRPGDGRGSFGCDKNREPSAAFCTPPTAGSPGWLPEAYPIQAPGPTTPLPFTDDTYIHDMTGDGLADIVKYEPETGIIRLWINQDGRTFLCATPGPYGPCSVNRYFDGLHATFTIDPHRITFADMDANGVDDMVLIGKSGVWASSVFNSPTGLSPRAPRPGVLVKIDNGLGATVLVDYRTIQELDLEAASNKQPWEFHSPQVVAIVTRIRTLDSRTASGIGTTPGGITGSCV